MRALAFSAIYLLPSVLLCDLVRSFCRNARAPTFVTKIRGDVPNILRFVHAVVPKRRYKIVRTPALIKTNGLPKARFFAAAFFGSCPARLLLNRHTIAVFAVAARIGAYIAVRFSPRQTFREATAIYPRAFIGFPTAVCVAVFLRCLKSVFVLFSSLRFPLSQI